MMIVDKALKFVVYAFGLIVLVVGTANATDNFYFRFRPSISIDSQQTFSVQIKGDRAGFIGSSFDAKVEASSPRETLQFKVSDGSLPPGIALNSSSGVISGHPTLKGAFRATITAQDAFSTASTPLNVQVYEALQIDSLVPQYATVGKPYSATFKGVGGDQSYSWTMTGTLPDGLSFEGSSSPTGSISGIPKTAGSWGGLRVGVSDGIGESASSSMFSITVADPLKLTGIAPVIATVGEPYEAAFSSTGGHTPLKWTQTGSLPEGLYFENGTIYGTPRRAEVTSGLVVKVGDSSGDSVQTQPFSIAVSQPLKLSVIATSLGTVGHSYSATFMASGGTGNYTWSYDGALPEGLNFTNGKITGSPTKVESASGIVIHVSDNEGRTTQSEPFSINVSDELALIGTPISTATNGIEYGSTLSTTGGAGGNVWAVVGGSLPSGLALYGGTIRGVPNATGTWSNIIIRVTDSEGRSKQTIPFSITVSDTLKIVGSLSNKGTVGVPYLASFSATGGDGNYSFVSVGSPLPPGLTLLNGKISGTPSAVVTTSNLLVRVTDNNGRMADYGPFSITISSAVAISGTFANTGKVGQGYSSSVASSGGQPPYVWSVVSGSLPNGLTQVGGTISGTPSNAGTWSFTLRSTDSDGRFADVSTSITIAPSITREPASGEYYDASAYVIIESPSSLPSLWNGSQIGRPTSNPWSWGGATYYKGSLMRSYSRPFYQNGHYVEIRVNEYAVYRTIP